MIRRKTYPVVSTGPHGGVIERRQEYKEAFDTSLNIAYIAIRDKIRALRAVNGLTSPIIESYLQQLKDENDDKISKLNHIEMIEYRSYVPAGRDLTHNSKAQRLPISSNKVAKLIEEETEMYHHREKVRRASKEMILVHLVIIFEEFLTEILTALFRKRPSLLKTLQKSITYEEAFKHSNLSELLTSIGRKEVDSRIDSDIEDLGKYLSKDYHIFLNKRTDWDQFKEHFYRRHVIVHNSGYPDSKYIQKTGYDGPIDWLEVDDKYLREAFKIFELYSDELRESFYNKYVKNKKKLKNRR